MTIELDPATVIVESGAAGNIGTTTTGNMVLHYPDGVGLKVESTDTNRYYALGYTLCTGVTVPRVGLVTAGAAHILPRVERSGSSVRFMSADELRTIEATGFMSGRRVKRRPARAVELPYEQQLAQAGTRTAGTVVTGLAISGSTMRAAVDSNLGTIQYAHAYAGQRMPVILLHGASFGGTDPTSAAVTFGGDQVMLGFLEAQFDRVAAQGTYFGETQAHQQGGRLVMRELV